MVETPQPPANLPTRRLLPAQTGHRVELSRRPRSRFLAVLWEALLVSLYWLFWSCSPSSTRRDRATNHCWETARRDRTSRVSSLAVTLGTEAVELWQSAQGLSLSPPPWQV